MSIAFICRLSEKVNAVFYEVAFEVRYSRTALQKRSGLLENLLSSGPRNPSDDPSLMKVV